MFLRIEVKFFSSCLTLPWPHNLVTIFKTTKPEILSAALIINQTLLNDF